MAERLIRCPKCGHEQHRGAECEVCGVIYARYKEVQNRKREEKEAREAAKAKSTRRMMSLLQVLLLVVLTAGGTYYFVKQDPAPAPAPAPVVTVQPAVEPVGQISDRPESQAVELQQRDETAMVPGRRTIEDARRATVSIETPWGTGSGFFVNDNYIVTNRHVIEIDQAKVDEFRRKVETTRELVELEKKKIRDLRSRMRRLPKGPARSQIQIVIEESEHELNKILPRLEEAEARLARMEEDVQPSDIKIILADGTSYSANYLMVSEKHDLALMSLYVQGVPFLQRPPANRPIRQGDKVFTIGSPVGLRNTVTSGVFSGYRQDQSDGSLFLQTDAPINPGNSGGPLIDEDGYVHGVNTMIIQGTEGIGFAIPINVVFEEFGSTLY